MPTNNNNNQPAIIFDLGGVLIDWNPEHLFSKMFNGNVKPLRFAACN